MADTYCPPPGQLVEERIEKVVTEYREAWNFLAWSRAALGELEQSILSTCAIPSYFDLDTAVGDQLTMIGKILGWPRCHCVCDASPVFGFECQTSYSTIQISGFCEDGSWIDCNDVGAGQVCLSDDEIYRGFLKARRYQMLGLYDIASLQAAAINIWGGNASIVDGGDCRVVISPGRELSEFDERILPLAFRVLPIAAGIRAVADIGFGLIFGFGDGWGGFCEGARWVCPVDPHTYDCAS